jgi:hypothetical protein
MDKVKFRHYECSIVVGLHISHEITALVNLAGHFVLVGLTVSIPVIRRRLRFCLNTTICARICGLRRNLRGGYARRRARRRRSLERDLARHAARPRVKIWNRAGNVLGERGGRGKAERHDLLGAGAAGQDQLALQVVEAERRIRIGTDNEVIVNDALFDLFGSLLLVVRAVDTAVAAFNMEL